MRIDVVPGSILDTVLRREGIPVESGKAIEIDAEEFSTNHEAEKRACVDQSHEEIHARAIARTIHKRPLNAAGEYGEPLTAFTTEMRLLRKTIIERVPDPLAVQNVLDRMWTGLHAQQVELQDLGNRTVQYFRLIAGLLLAEVALLIALCAYASRGH